MMKLDTIEMFHTSLGLKVIIDKIDVAVNDKIIINGEEYTVIKIDLPPKADDERIILTLSNG